MSRILTRSNSDLLAIQMVSNNTSMSPQARMAAIEEIVNEWSSSSTFDPHYYTAVKEFEQRKDSGTLYEPLN